MNETRAFDLRFQGCIEKTYNNKIGITMASSKSLILPRLLQHLAVRIQQNQRFLSSSSSSAISEASSSSSSLSASDDALHMTDDCVRRLKELQASEASSEQKMLRLSVETGGCSGFQYEFNLGDKINSDDRVFEREGVKLIVDNISYDFVKGATVDYVEELIRSAFTTGFVWFDTSSQYNLNKMRTLALGSEQLVLLVIMNPSAVGGCSCKASFMPRQ